MTVAGVVCTVAADSQDAPTPLGDAPTSAKGSEIDIAPGESRKNNLNLIRFLAAAGVVFSHSYALTGHLDAEPVARFLKISDLASACVMVFFVISGYLITQSATRRPSVQHFVAARVLRLLPALALSTLVTVLVIGPLATGLSVGAYFSSADTWKYLTANLVLDTGRSLPGVFENNPLPHAVNGSLWTIRVEAFLYAVVLVASAIGVLSKRSYAAIFIAICFAMWFAFPGRLMAMLPANDTFMTPRLIACFMLGAVLYLYRERIPPSLVAAAVLALVAYASVLALSDANDLKIALFYCAFYVAVAYCTITFAFHPSLQMPAFNRVGDFSYGLYVLAFPIQQLIVQSNAPMHPLRLFAYSIAATLPCAIVSWIIVESPALQMKRAFLRRPQPLASNPRGPCVRL